MSGQIGAGKTSITSLVTRAPAVRGESVNISLDPSAPCGSPRTRRPTPPG
ncbi:hypothetical protein [Streptomyces sp. NBC_00090]